MTRMRRATVTTCILAICAQPIAAQSLALIARNAPDSVALRWAPLSAEAWRQHHAHGYKVERLHITRSGIRAEALSASPIKPYSLDLMAQRFAATDQRAGAVAQLLHGPEMAKGSNGADALATAERGAQELQMRWSTCLLLADLHPDMAEALGLRCVDRSPPQDGLLQYRVIVLDPQHPDTAIVGVDRQYANSDVPEGPAIAAEERDGSVELRWSSEDGEPFSGYWIERSTDGKDWKRLQAQPHVPTRPAGTVPPLCYYSDTTITNYRPYQYRVLGINSFGEVSTRAMSITAMGRDRTATAAPTIESVTDEHGRLVVRWKLDPVAQDLRGFRVEKALTANGARFPLHDALLPTTARDFTDTSSFLLGENHYRVAAIDTAGNAAYSLDAYGYLIDSVAPSPPNGLVGSIDTTGVVTVRWRMGGEADLRGYRVFFANAADHEFNNLTPQPLTDTVFTDTVQVRTLTKRIYYRIVAVDQNFNHSAFSATLSLARPDLVPPAPPVIKNYSVSDTAVTIEFVQSSSSDLKAHRLLRKAPGDGTWSEVLLLPATDKRHEWTDRNVAGPAYYSYTMVALDSAGNRSDEAAPITVRVHATLKRGTVQDVRASRIDDRIVQVNWSSIPGAVKHYVVYRSKDGGQPIVVGHTPAGTSTYTDIRLTGKGAYNYAVQAVFQDGGNTALANAATAVTLP